MDSDSVSAIAAALSTIAAGVSLFVAWKSVDIAAKARVATERQANIAADARREMIRPYVAIYTRNYVEDVESIYLFVENVGVGPAVDVEFNLIEGENFAFSKDSPLKIWRPLEKGIEILRPRERFWTLLAVYKKQNQFKDVRIVISAKYKDIEGRIHQTAPVLLEFLPNSGAVWGTDTKTRNGEIVSQTLMKPSEP